MALSQEQYRESGLKLTPQRMAILAYLEGNILHPSAEDVFRAVRRRFPTMSFATVYNTLEMLKKRGKVVELTGDPDKKRFDPNIRPHHHLICTGCRKIVDLKTEFNLTLKAADQAGFQIMGNHIEFTGLCPDCQRKR
ncbi:MAG: transcriptional repressor [Nitrospirota bacterium]|nr:transcriptional repressor [Nitrospirota bacterium]